MPLNHIPIEKQLLDRAIGAALRYLSHRPRSAAELKIWLTKRFDPAVTHTVLEKMHCDGLVDDLKFSEFWVDNRSAYRPRSTRLIHQELRMKGISRDIADRAIDHLDNEELALKVALDRSKKISHLPKSPFLKKMVAHLQRRGFHFTESRKAAHHAWNKNEGAHCTEIGTSISI